MLAATIIAAAGAAGIEQDLEGLVDGGHFFDLLAEDVVFEFINTVPNYSRQVVGRDNLVELYRGYGSILPRRAEVQDEVCPGPCRPVAAAGRGSDAEYQ